MKNLQKVFSLLFFLIWIDYFTCSNSSSNILLRKKRILTTSILEVIGHLSSSLGIIDSLSNKLQSNRDTQIIFETLESISNELKSTFCVSLDNRLQDNLIRIDNLLSSFKEYANHYDKYTIENNLKDICYHEVQGIKNIYSNLKHILGNDQIIKYFRACYTYKSEDVDRWSKSIEKMSSLFVVLVVGCEQVFEYKTSFNLNLFLSEVKAIIIYYRDQGFDSIEILIF